MRETPASDGLSAFNEPVDTWFDFFMFTIFTDRDGKSQLLPFSESALDPLSRTTRFMLTEEAHLMLPVGTPPNAIVFGTGAVSIVEMARGGLLLNLVAAVLITIGTVLLGPWALGLIIR